MCFWIFYDFKDIDVEKVSSMIEEGDHEFMRSWVFSINHLINLLIGLIDIDGSDKRYVVID